MPVVSEGTLMLDFDDLTAGDGGGDFGPGVLVGGDTD
jgi:hypothetical protein